MVKPEQNWADKHYEFKKYYKAYHQKWNKNGIKITYTGTEVSATAEVKANSLELAAPALTVVYNIDLTAAAYDTLAELVAYINGFADWECELGDQFEGFEASASLTVVGATDVKTAGVWFVQDTNLQIKIVIPPPALWEQITLTETLGEAAYSTGNSIIQVFDGTNLIWEQKGVPSTVEFEASFSKITITTGNSLIVKLVNSSNMTDGCLSINYEVKKVPPDFTI